MCPFLCHGSCPGPSSLSRLGALMAAATGKMQGCFSQHALGPIRGPPLALAHFHLCCRHTVANPGQPPLHTCRPDAGWACSESCKLEASRSYIRARLDASAATFKKPVVVEEFGKLRPAAVRNAFYAMVYDELKAAQDKDQPVGGSLFWMLAGRVGEDGCMCY